MENGRQHPRSSAADWSRRPLARRSVASAMAFLIRRWILHHQTPLSRRFLAQRELDTETGATETALSSSQFNLEHYGLMAGFCAGMSTTVGCARLERATLTEEMRSVRPMPALPEQSFGCAIPSGVLAKWRVEAISLLDTAPREPPKSSSARQRSAWLSAVLSTCLPKRLAWRRRLQKPSRRSLVLPASFRTKSSLPTRIRMWSPPNVSVSANWKDKMPGSRLHWPGSAWRAEENSNSKIRHAAIDACRCVLDPRQHSNQAFKAGNLHPREGNLAIALSTSMTLVFLNLLPLPSKTRPCNSNPSL